MPEAKSLFDRQGFEAFILSLKSVEIVRQWGDASVGKVGGKIFALYTERSENDEFQIAFKCSDMSFEMLPLLAGVRAAKYLARAKWVDVSASSELGENDLRAYINQAHRLVAGKLTKRVKTELGLSAGIFNNKAL